MSNAWTLSPSMRSESSLEKLRAPQSTSYVFGQHEHDLTLLPDFQLLLLFIVTSVSLSCVVRPPRLR